MRGRGLDIWEVSRERRRAVRIDDEERQESRGSNGMVVLYNR